MEQCKQGFLWYNSHTSSFQMDKKKIKTCDNTNKFESMGRYTDGVFI